jgi:large subunit ribosomal protein L13
MKTAVTKPGDISRKWYVIDAEGEVLGRLSTRVARLLLGKDRPEVSRSVDMADFIIVINASSIRLTGRKKEQKRYYHHSGYPGGIKERTIEQIGMSQALRLAVRGMLPKNKLQDPRLSRLKIYEGSEHPHEAQQPEVLGVKEQGDG